MAKSQFRVVIRAIASCRNAASLASSSTSWSRAFAVRNTASNSTSGTVVSRGRRAGARGILESAAAPVPLDQSMFLRSWSFLALVLPASFESLSRAAIASTPSPSSFLRFRLPAIARMAARTSFSRWAFLYSAVRLYPGVRVPPFAFVCLAHAVKGLASSPSQPRPRTSLWRSSS